MSGICVENIADIVLWLQGQKAMSCSAYPGPFIEVSLQLIFASAVQELRTLPVIEWLLARSTRNNCSFAPQFNDEEEFFQGFPNERDI